VLLVALSVPSISSSSAETFPWISTTRFIFASSASERSSLRVSFAISSSRRSSLGAPGRAVGAEHLFQQR
jgi:hypothetical protein